MKNKRDKIIDVFRRNGGFLRPKDLRKEGYDPRWVYRLLEEAIIEKVHWGLYKLREMPSTNYSGFAEIARAIPAGIICLRSALAYYEFTTYNPSIIDVAIKRDSRPVDISYPPVKVWEFSLKFFDIGKTYIRIAETDVAMFDKEKTICDCFRFRNKIGIDIAKEGLQEYLKLKDRDIPKLLKYAEICRVKAVMRPYLDAML